MSIISRAITSACRVSRIGAEFVSHYKAKEQGDLLYDERGLP